MHVIQVNRTAFALAAIALAACSPSGAPSARSSDGVSEPAGSATTSAVEKTAPDPLVVAADRARIRGDSAARVWLIVASDFQCPFCKDWHEASHAALERDYVRTGKIRIAYFNFPLNQHRNAMPTANAAMCAGAQNRFWQYHDALFETQASWSGMPDPTALLDSLAGAVAVNVPSWKQCVESGRMRPMILADRERAIAAGVQSTPTFLIGNRLVTGAIPIADLRVHIDAELARSATPTR